MKIRIVYFVLGIIGMGFLGYAKDLPGMKKNGAHWATLPERAKIQLLIDELKTAAQENTLETALQKRAVKRFLGQANIDALKARLAGREAGDAELSVAENGAVIEWENSDQLLLQKGERGWQIVGSQIAGSSVDIPRAERVWEGDPVADLPGFSAGKTLTHTFISRDHNIERLSRSVTETKLDRQLFGAPEKSASFYSARFSDDAPFVSATFVQFVLDPAWNRVLYGSLERWIKSYDDVTGPSAIAVDASGRVFIGETGRQRISVLQLHPDAENSALTFSFAIENVGEPVDIALDDNGTPLKNFDDVLYVADAAGGKIVKYTLSGNIAEKIAEFSDFDSPSVVLTGKWDGANNGLVYVIDAAGQRLRQFAGDVHHFSAQAEIHAQPGQYFQAMTSDHFGNIYVVDAMNAKVIKYSAQLAFLDAAGQQDATFNGLTNLDIPFGKIEVEGQDPFWAGFDQLFTLERWTENSGAQRFTLGTRIKKARFFAGEDAEIHSHFTLTDFANVQTRMYDERDLLVREIDGKWMISGEKNIVWDRRDDRGQQVSPGNYRFEIAAKSPYRDETTTLSARFYLPLFYHIDCGNAQQTDKPFRLRGKTVSWGVAPNQTAVQDPDRVSFRFRELNPQSRYQLQIEGAANSDLETTQRILSGNGEVKLALLSFSKTPVRSGFIDLPQKSYETGELSVIVEKLSGMGASVSQMWLKETGVGLNVQVDQQNGENPSAFTLGDNYPNPFNPSTQIQFSLPQNSKIRLEIFNLLGQKVRVLVDNALPAGSHIIEWNGRNEHGVEVASGIYFYRMVAENFVQTKRMLLMR